MESLPVRPQATAQAGRPAGTNTPAQQAHGPRKPKKQNRLKKIALIVVPILVLLIVILGSFVVYMSSTSAHIDRSKYQAVFFTNGQVYFGKLHKLSGGYFKLTDIFYLQANSTEESDSANPQAASSQNDTNVQLIKLGSEVHGPEDAMIMSKDQILFFENLKGEGTVSDTIKQYNEQQKK